MTHFGEIDFLMTKFGMTRQHAINTLLDSAGFDDAVDRLQRQAANRVPPASVCYSAPMSKKVTTPMPVSTIIGVGNEDAKGSGKGVATKKTPNGKEEDKEYKGPKILPKSYTKHTSDTAKLTNWIEVPIRELVDFCRYQIDKEKVNPKDFICPICQMEYYDNMLTLADKDIDDLNTNMVTGSSPIDIVLLSKCKRHFFHKDCIEAMAKSSTSLKCPLCGVIYGIILGDMPPGHMNHKRICVSCEGYEMHGSLQIDYSFRPGVMNGKRYEGTHRKAYLPDNAEGNEVLRLLEIAFDRGLLFTVGTSMTTGAQQVIVWNGVHHKTALSGGAAVHGYPDPTYLQRVKEELAAKGVC